MSGGTLAKMTLMHWCRPCALLMWVGMFFVWDNPVSWVVALVVMVATYFVEVIDRQHLRTQHLAQLF